ncbi:MAG TPA: heavy-metal-associated domain-containing protein [Geobacteraceae bacterium]
MKVVGMLVAMLLVFGLVTQTVAAERQVELTVYDMVCASCAVAVDKALRGLSGIRGVTVERAKNRAVILYEAKQVTPDQMIQSLRKAGYRAELRKQ